MKRKEINVKHFSKDLKRATVLVIKASPATALYTIIIIVLQSALPVLSLYFTKQLIELITQQAHGSFTKIFPIVIGFSIVQLISALIGQWSTYIGTIQQQRITDYLSRIVLTKAISVGYEYYENPKYYDTLHLAQQQSVFRVTQLLSNINSVVINVLSLVFLGSLFITLQWFYAVLCIALSIPMAIIKWYYSFKMFQLEKELVPVEREANYLHQILTWVTHAKEVRVFGYGSSFIKKFKAIKWDVFKKRRKLNARQNLFSLLSELFEIIVIAFVFIMLAKGAWEKTISVGVFVIYLQGFQRLQGAAKGLLQSIVQLLQQRLFLRDLFGFLDIQSYHSDLKNTNFPTLQKGLSIQNVSFTYPGTETQILKNVSMQCKPGSIMAIVGENGSGKSTLVKLLARLYHNQQGSILIEDENINDIDNNSFRLNTVFLFQDFEKYFFTIKENIALGMEDAAIDNYKIKQAAILSGADAYIQKFTDGYETRLGRTFRDSEQLSGGQWQKLGLARAFYKDAQIIVLDEPSSSIDPLAEHELFEHLKELAKTKIIILISHKLYNIRIADYIYVMKDGTIAEEGSFTELVNKNGLFNSMYQKQKLDD